MMTDELHSSASQLNLGRSCNLTYVYVSHKKVLMLSLKVDECKALVFGAYAGGTHGGGVWGRALHSSTSQLNLSAFCGIGVHLGIV